MISQKHPGPGLNTRDQGKRFQNSTVMTEFERLSIMEALDHLFVTKKYQEVGSCTLCKKVCLKRSTPCGAFYCSVDCQTSDWQTHKVACSKCRTNEPDHNNSSSVNTPVVDSFDKNSVHNDKENFSGDINQGITDRVSPFKALANQVKRTWNNSEENKPVSNFNKFQNSNQNQQQQPQQQQSYFNGKNEGKRFSSGSKGDMKKPHQNNEPKKNFVPRKISNSFEKNTKSESHSVKNDNWEHGSERSVLSKSFTQNKKESSSNTSMKPKQEVTCTYRESSIRYWVLNVDDLPLYEKIQTTLAEECESYESVQPKVGFIGGCNYANEWYRGKIVSVTPKVTVHFIDYGNTSQYDFGVVKKLPAHLRSSDGLARLIEFEEGTPEEYKIEDLHSLKLTIKETRKTADGVSCVKITKGIFGVTSTMDDSSESEAKVSGSPNIERLRIATELSNRSVVDSLTVTSKGMILFSPGGGSAKFGSVVPDNDLSAKECIKETIQYDTSNSSPIEAKVGDYVLVRDSEGNDQRGKVLYKLGSTYYVKTIDCGNIVMTESVFEMPKHGKDFIQLGGLITMKKIISQDAASKMGNFLFEIKGEAKFGKWPCLFKDYSEQKPVAEGIIEKCPDTLEADPQYVPLKSDCLVELCVLLSSNSAYVRAIDNKTSEKIQEINGTLKDFTSKAKNFKFAPPVGALCSAKFNEDQCFYRARVVSVKDNKVTVLFVDFGNTQETDLSNIKSMPDSLKRIPFFAVKVTLSKVSPKPCSKAVNEFLERLITEGTELILLYKKSVTEGVTLKVKETGVNVNEFIENENVDKPKTGSSIVRPLKSEKFLTDEDLKYSSLVTGTKCELFLLHVNESEFESTFSFWATDGGSKNLLNVFETLNSKIAEYCEKFSTPYRPKAREICLALFDGGWYRALTVEERKNEYLVFFLDFGNVCSLGPDSIRKIKPEFIEDPVLAVNCVINGHERLNKNRSLAKKVFEMLEENTNLTVSDVEIVGFENDTFLVVIPEVEKLLSR